MNEQIKDTIIPGYLGGLRQALDVLARAHTRDDPVGGFVVEMYPRIGVIDIGRQEYIEAWRIVRESLGYATRPGGKE